MTDSCTTAIGQKALVCKRCFINLDSLVSDSIAKQLDSVPQDDKTPADEYRARLSKCRACDSLAGETCMQCGSFVQVRAAVRNASCPKARWDYA